MRATLLGALALSLCVIPTAAFAQSPYGFQTNRYEPTTAGEWGFMVDRPWYSSTRHFSLGLTLDYGHAPLVTGTRAPGNEFVEQTGIFEHQFFGHIDMGVSIADRLTLSASLPVLIYDSGTASNGITPVSNMAVGDPRVGAMIRVFGHADRSPISLHLGANVWIPVKGLDFLGDEEVRVMPKLVLAGYGHHIQWAVTGAYYFRPESSIGDEPRLGGNSSGDEVQIGAAIAYADFERRFTVGPEALLSTVVKDGDAFASDWTSLALLLGASYNIASEVQIGLAGGIGLLQQPGNPDARGLLRIAYAPISKGEKAAPKFVDTDGDTIADASDKCPKEPEDLDGVADSDGCPETDGDGDGIVDESDKCPNEAGQVENLGCPDRDNDNDGIVDRLDQCPDEAEDMDGFQDEDGCPDRDNDSDGVVDTEDRCPNEVGPSSNFGCPEPDRDGDTVIDRLDNCPDEFGSVANQGCAKKQLAKISEGRIEISQAVFFNTGTATIGKTSFPLLNNIAAILKAHPELNVKVEGHSDNVGNDAKNLKLSQRRADAVVTYLVKQGVAADRMTAEGFGSSQPIESNATKEGRSKNRRVVFSTTVRSTAVPAGGVQ